MIRLHGELTPLAHPPLSPTDTKNLCYSLLTEAQKKKFEEDLELDFSFGIKGVSRFRGNLFSQKGALGGAFRMIPHTVPQLQQLGVLGQRERMDLAVDRLLADPPRDQLGVLRAEVEDEDLVAVDVGHGFWSLMTGTLPSLALIARLAATPARPSVAGRSAARDQPPAGR